MSALFVLGLAALAVISSALGLMPWTVEAELVLMVLMALVVGNTIFVKVPYSRAYVTASEVLILMLVLAGGWIAVPVAALIALLRPRRSEVGVGAWLYGAVLSAAAAFLSAAATTQIAALNPERARVEQVAGFLLTIVAASLIHSAALAVTSAFDEEGGKWRVRALANVSAWGLVVYLAAASLAGLAVLASGWVSLSAVLAVIAAAAVAHSVLRGGAVEAGRSAAGGSAREGVGTLSGDDLLEGAFDSAQVGAALLSSRGEMLRVNPALCDFLGRAEGELVGADLQSIMHPDDSGQALAGIKDLLRGKAESLETEVRNVLKDGGHIWAQWHVGKFESKATDETHLVLQVQDITERKHSEQRLLHDAFHDPLTSLPNRALFIDHVKLTISRARRHGERTFAVLFIDLDRFKIINDSLGHLAGDQLLVGVARRIESCLREGDTVARVGGDEFTVLLEDLQDVEEAVTVVERIQHEVSAPFTIDGHEVFTTLSIGVAPGSTEYADPEDILRDADTAMYRAKTLGKARHEVFDKAMHAFAVNLLQIETDLRKALDREQFFLVYQPIVGLDDFSICGFEALVRWQHPERGLISPMDFIPVAEETGQIVAIGEWALVEACRQMTHWHRRFPLQFPFFISVNLSTRQFSEPGLVARVGEILNTTLLNPRSLKLEITESAVIENIDKTTDLLKQLRALGVQLSIDDFGTGYSSLSYLHRFPIDTLKIDRSFVTRMSDNSENVEIVRTIVMLAQTLGMDVVAEGVETKEQLKMLRQLGCEYGQGYYFSKPLGAEEAERIIAETCEPKPDRAQEVFINDKVKSIRLAPTA